MDEFPEALGGLPDPVVVVDGDGVVRGATARVEPVLGYAPEDVTGTDVESLLSDPDDGAAGDELRRYVVHPEPRSVSPGLELVARRADGSTVPVTVGFGSFDSDGETYLAVTIVDAETGREAGHRRTQTLEALHEATQDLLKTTEREVAAGTAVEYIEEVLGHPIAAIWLYDAERELLDPVCWTDAADRVVDEHPTFTADEPSISWRVFESGEAEYISDTHAEPDRYDSDSPIRSELVLPLGRYGMIHVGATEPDAFTESDLAVARLWAATVTMVFVRIERERQLKAQQQAVARERDRLKDFASVVSHDLRNPLNVAAGNLEMVRTRLADAGAESTELDVVDRSIRRMEDIIADMLTLAREGTAIDETEPVSLSTLAEGCWDGVDTASASLSVRGDVRVQADRSRLRQAVENLFRNAVSHGGDEVSVAVGPLGDGAGFYVEDDGPGIPAESRKEVFEAGVSTDPEGTGLGLKIVSEVADAHGWTVSAVAGSDGGARFEFRGVDLA